MKLLMRCVCFAVLIGCGEAFGFRLCGAKLTAMLDRLCERQLCGGFFAFGPTIAKRSEQNWQNEQPFDELMERRRPRRKRSSTYVFTRWNGGRSKKGGGIASECCAKRCTLSYMSTYCCAQRGPSYYYRLSR